MPGQPITAAPAQQATGEEQATSFLDRPAGGGDIPPALTARSSAAINPVDLAHKVNHAVGWSAGECGFLTAQGPAWLLTCTAGKPAR
jgi:hypothetical protein